MTEIYGYIYKIVNTINNKIYIGQTIQIPIKRRNSHFGYLRNNKHWNEHLQRSFNKYGESNFKFTVLNYATNKKTLDKLESDYIEYYDCLNKTKGYNLQTGGANGKPSIETRKKLSKSLTGKKRSIETRERLSKALKGRIITEEHRQKIKESRPDTSGKNNPFYGRKHTLESRMKISKNHADLSGKNHPLYGKTGKMNPNYGKERTLEDRKKKSLARRGRGLFGFTVNLDKRVNPEKRCWFIGIKFNTHRKTLGYFIDPLSANIVYDFVWNEIYSN